jgi:hypothetical protein
VCLLKVSPATRECTQRRSGYLEFWNGLADPRAVPYEGHVRYHRVGAVIFPQWAGNSAEEVLAKLGSRPDERSVRNLLEPLDPS